MHSNVTTGNSDATYGMMAYSLYKSQLRSTFGFTDQVIQQGIVETDVAILL
jgi:hypothetical protein